MAPFASEVRFRPPKKAFEGIDHAGRVRWALGAGTQLGTYPAKAGPANLGFIGTRGFR